MITQLEECCTPARPTPPRAVGTAPRDGRLDVKLSSPGIPGSGTNPEQLFAAGWSACFIGAMKLAAGGMNVALPADLAVSTPKWTWHNGGAYFLQARLNASLPRLESKLPRPWSDAAHQTCPYSESHTSVSDRARCTWGGDPTCRPPAR